MTQAIDHLRSVVRKERAMPVIGTGVSVWSAPGASSADWRGLLNHGIAHCRTHANVTEEWSNELDALVAKNTADAFIAAAAQVSSALAAPGEPFRRWLVDAIGQLRVTRPDLLTALGALSPTLLTTNYDTFAEHVLRLPAVTWKQRPMMHRVVVGDECAVIHLHGIWKDPETVVLDEISYKRVIQDPFVEAMLRSLVVTKGLVFVGFGGGLADPNFSRLRAWMRTWRNWSPYGHFRLVRRSELDNALAMHSPDERILPIVYGDNYDDFPHFIRDLTALRVAATARSETRWRMLSYGQAPLPSLRDAVLSETIYDLGLAAARASNGQSSEFTFLCTLQRVAKDASGSGLLKLWSHRSAFIAAAEQWNDLIEDFMRAARSGTADRKAQLRTQAEALRDEVAEWSVDSKVAALGDLSCVRVVVDGAAKSVLLATDESASINPADYPNHVASTSELLQLICALASPGIGLMSFDMFGERPELVPLVIDLIDRSLIRFDSIRVNADCDEQWRYVNPEFDEEIGETLPIDGRSLPISPASSSS